MMTTLIAGVVARSPEGALKAHLRPLGSADGLYGHFHAAVFSYRPLPQRTVELGALTRALFTNHQLRDVLHLLWDERGSAGVAVRPRLPMHISDCVMAEATTTPPSSVAEAARRHPACAWR